MRVGPARHLGGVLRRGVQRAYPSLPHDKFSMHLQRSSLPSSKAHYQLAVAFPIAKHLGVKPRDVAARIIAETPADEALASVELSGAGFVNVRARPAWLAAQLPHAAEVPQAERPLRVIVDYASPNMAKELHVGHLRTIVIGDALSRILEARGHRVTRVSHVGDFGTPLAQTLQQLREEHEASATPASAAAAAAQLSAPQLAALYASAKTRAATDAGFVQRAQQFLAAMQQSEPTAERQLWEAVCAASRRSYAEIFHVLGVSPELRERGEASYAPHLADLVAELLQKGVAHESDGALLIPPPPESAATVAPLIVRKRDGTYGYATTDLAALRARVQEGHEWLLYVVDRSQSAHLKGVFAAARAASLLPEGVRVTHLPFGVVRGESGSKLASRSGAPPALSMLLSEAVQEATRALGATRALLAAESHASPGEPPRRQGLGASLETDAEALGIAAVKYFELAQHPSSDYVFSLPRVMALRGNTALYLNYAAARIAALQRRAAASGGTRPPPVQVNAVEGDEEEALALKLCQFSEAVELAESDLAPSHVCTYLFELTQRFHAFYDECRIVGNERQTPRLALAAATSAVLAKGYALLGLRAAQVL